MPVDLISRARLVALLSSVKKHRIAVIGDAMLDVYLTGDVERVSPEAPVPVVRVRDRRFALGGAANVAQNVAALGATAELVATVGSDESAKRLKALLKSQGGDSRGLVPVDRPTTTKTRIVARAQQVVRVDEEIDSDCSSAEITKLKAAILRAVKDSDALILEDYNKGVLVAPVIQYAIAAATKKGIPVVVDPKYRNFFEYRGATIFKPNRRELEAALGAAVDVEHPQTLPGLVEKLGVEAILLTLSERGMALIERGAACIVSQRRRVTCTTWSALVIRSRRISRRCSRAARRRSRPR
jgi:D-glycero-beta-D-manno-heptose-7-phosphate kinase